MTDVAPSTLVIVGEDPQQTLDLRRWVEAKDGWHCRVVTTQTQATTEILQSAAPTVVACVSDDTTYQRALEVLSVAKATKTPSIVIYNRLDSPQLLDLFRAGAAECLGRPVNLSRLSLVLDMVDAPRRIRNSMPRSTHGFSAAPDANVPASILGVETSLGDRTATAGADDCDAAQPRSLDDRQSEQIERVAAIDTTIVITGETGTGKTRLAKAIHNASPRRDKPFLAVNCGALSDTLMDSELFGHVKGAFTGADQHRTGKLAQCQDGTLLLDEVDMLAPAAQVRLLQVVEDRTFQPLGGSEQLQLKARLIVASNRNLREEVDAGRFRSDLYYRLNVMTFRMPPLRERQSEIELLARQFAEEFSAHHGFSSAQISGTAMSALRAFHWPGNIRELRNIVERAVVLSAGETIGSTHLPEPLQRIVSEQVAKPWRESEPHHDDAATIDKRHPDRPPASHHAPGIHHDIIHYDMRHVASAGHHCDHPRSASGDLTERGETNSAPGSVICSNMPSANMPSANMPSANMHDVNKQGANKLAVARLEAERTHLLQALSRNDNNRSKTAVDLGISRVALYKRLRKLHIL